MLHWGAQQLGRRWEEGTRLNEGRGSPFPLSLLPTCGHPHRYEGEREGRSVGQSRRGALSHSGEGLQGGEWLLKQ